MNIEDLLARDIDEHLVSSGWLKLEGGPVEEKALSDWTEMVARRLGTPTRGRSLPVVEILKPRRPGEAPSASLSGKYGFEQFPFHVDGAHWSTPARFLVLACLRTDEHRTPTLLVDRMAIALTSDEEALLRSAVYLVRNGRNSFYASIVSIGQPFVRLDPGCMEPLSPEGEAALRLFSGERLSPHVQRITWNAGDVTIVDNWRMLHARAPVQSTNSDRVLLRCLVM
ncbi:hypothetical protein Rleg_1584 [Rhizobium leguminosarum bv. trifolii WSM1325]|uniref:TauD/TfdA-like domain-containing protein n=1 Tax=Rhizobium leguminosarum bv. trifolii (strain WSM1325) TaxID=395491 RepID=C6AVR1_RHILS|nr:TauD/TfdA family dioxygenase [Rhizobium leguminosarum]ACS55872.1 hypothetical protein Rleg_1584 [Rhizobium leguminosarum bv. trifolii WSM1325]